MKKKDKSLGYLNIHKFDKNITSKSDSNTKCKNIIKKKYFFNCNTIFIILLIVSGIIIIVSIIINESCKNNKNILNNEIKYFSNNVLIPYVENLKDIICYINKNQTPFLTSSNCEYMNEISNMTAKTINEILIDNGFAEITNNHLGIFEYFCDGKCELKKKIVTKFLLNNFLTVNEDKLEKNIYDTNDITFLTLENIFQIINSVNNCLKDINLS
jgi:hypothetical protein